MVISWVESSRDGPKKEMRRQKGAMLWLGLVWFGLHCRFLVLAQVVQLKVVRSFRVKTEAMK